MCARKAGLGELGLLGAAGGATAVHGVRRPCLPAYLEQIGFHIGRRPDFLARLRFRLSQNQIQKVIENTNQCSEFQTFSRMNLKEKDEKYIWHPFNHKGTKIIPIVRAEGAYIYGEDNKRYIDAFSSWWVNLHGHCHPYIANKIAEQTIELEHVAFGGFTHPQAIKLAE